ncbi:hypothetical protein [Micrococcus luteus]|uniref:hypothetical protein n=1 Tax=Micrococcus luteus TaxID=1270 RepID=UPI003D33CE43
MTDLTPDHPAVEAALLAGYGQREETFAPEMAAALTAALPHLTADDLRDTDAGRALMAEGWEEAVLRHARGSAETRRVLASVLPNPYLEADA